MTIQRSFLLQPARHDSVQQQQPGQFISGAGIARDRRNRGANRRSSESVIPRHSSSNSRLPKVIAEEAKAIQGPNDVFGVTGLAIQAGSQLPTAGGCSSSLPGDWSSA